MYLHWTPEYRRWYENARKEIQQQQVNHQRNCAQVIVHQLCGDRKRKIGAAAQLILSMGDTKSYNERLYWETPLCKLRKEHGFYHAILPALKLENLGYKNYFRMSATQLQNLLQLVGPKLSKKYMIREPIDAGERLCSTLRFSASGDSVHSMHYQYLFGTSTASNIFSETCAVIWDLLQPEVLPEKIDEKEWLQIADDYEKKWNFPHCVGSIDGKHINIQCPSNAGSMYCNYKHPHSIVLLAICDSNYVFRFVDIGAYGRRSDGGIFADSLIGRKFEADEMNLPRPSELSASRPTPLPYCLFGDEAFPLKTYLMRPYPGKQSAALVKRVFNYRLSRARKIIENTFGILAMRFRIFRNSIIGSEKNIIDYVKAGICLHNWLRFHDLENNSEDSYLDKEIDQQQNNKSDDVGLVPGAFRDITRTGANNPSYKAEHVREEFRSYFNNEGALDWQYDYV